MQPTADKAVRHRYILIKEWFYVTQIIREITVDVAQTNTLRAITAKQNDLNSRFLKIHITNGGTPIEVDPSAIVTMNVKRTDDISKPFKGSVNDDGSVTVPLTSWMLELAGSINCDVSIIAPTASQKLTTMQFSIYVEEAVYPQSELENDENYDLLVELLDAAEKAEACAEATEDAKEATEKANAAADGVVITEQNKKGPLTFWVGTQAEYDALVEKDMSCFYIISDDSDLEAIQNRIAALATAMNNMHTPQDISGAVVRENTLDTCILYKYGKMLSLHYIQTAHYTPDEDDAFDWPGGTLATIKGYEPLMDNCVAVDPKLSIGRNKLNGVEYYDTVFAKVCSDGEGNTKISLESFTCNNRPAGAELTSFSISFLCK